MTDDGGRAAALHADALVWDNHSGFEPHPAADLDQLERWRAAGVDYLSVTVGYDVISWQATLVVFVIPFLLCRFLMMAGNWGQHAFVDASDPGNPYKSSVTCINARYNRRCFNDGYHIGHHVQANRHWTEMPEDFERDRANYTKNDAIVFEGLDNFTVWPARSSGRR